MFWADQNFGSEVSVLLLLPSHSALEPSASFLPIKYYPFIQTLSFAGPTGPESHNMPTQQQIQLLPDDIIEYILRLSVPVYSGESKYRCKEDRLIPLMGPQGYCRVAKNWYTLAQREALRYVTLIDGAPSCTLVIRALTEESSDGTWKKAELIQKLRATQYVGWTGMRRERTMIEKKDFAAGVGGVLDVCENIQELEVDYLDEILLEALSRLKGKSSLR